MKSGLRLLLVLALLGVVASPAMAAPTQGAVPVPAKTTLPEVESELMCSVCKVPLNQSDSAFANQERRAVEDLIARGLTKDEVIAEMVRIYSTAVLLNPPDQTVRTLRWILPAAGALLALLLLTVLIRRWRRRAQADAIAAPDPAAPEPDELPAPEITDDDERRLNADLSRYA